MPVVFLPWLLLGFTGQPQRGAAAPVQGTHVAADIMYVVVGVHMASTQPESTTPPIYSEYTSTQTGQYH